MLMWSQANENNCERVLTSPLGGRPIPGKIGRVGSKMSGNPSWHFHLEIKQIVTIDGKMSGDQSQQTWRNIMVQCEIRQIQGLCDISDVWVANALFKFLFWTQTPNSRHQIDHIWHSLRFVESLKRCVAFDQTHCICVSRFEWLPWIMYFYQK